MTVKVFIPSGAGAPGFGGISECLREWRGLEIYAGDIHTRAYGKNLADGFSLMPATTNPAYLGAVFEKSAAFGCNALLPITTAELPVLSSAENALKKQGINIAICPEHSMALINDKAKLYEFLRQIHLPYTSFEVVNNKTDFFTSLRLLNFPHKKIAMKPVQGNGSRGFRIVCTEQELRQEYFDTKAGSVKTTEAALHAELPDNFPFDIVLCDYLPGEEYSVDLLADRGKVLALAIRVREKTVSGISVRGTFINDADMEKQCRVLTDNLDLHGPVGIQFKRDENGVAKLLEINPRLQGAVSTARYVGLNFPVMAIQLAMGMPVETRPPAVGVSFNRYWKDIKE